MTSLPIPSTTFDLYVILDNSNLNNIVDYLERTTLIHNTAILVIPYWSRLINQHFKFLSNKIQLILDYLWHTFDLSDFSRKLNKWLLAFDINQIKLWNMNALYIFEKYSICYYLNCYICSIFIIFYYWLTIIHYMKDW